MSLFFFFFLWDLQRTPLAGCHEAADETVIADGAALLAEFGARLALLARVFDDIAGLKVADTEDLLARPFGAAADLVRAVDARIDEILPAVDRAAHAALSGLPGAVKRVEEARL